MGGRIEMKINILEGKNILIIGASRGLGEAIANTIWGYGANIALVSRDEEKLKNVASLLDKREHQRSSIFPKDLSSPNAVTEIFDFAQTVFHHLDVLVYNAAIQGPIGPLWENDWDLWEKAINVNLLAAIRLSHLCAKWMLPHQEGKMIFLSGGGATSSRPNFSSYAVAKTGLVRFCEVLADELELYNIQANCVAPGTMATSLLNDIVIAGPNLAGQKEFYTALQAQRGGGTPPEKAAELVAFLASTLSHGITGKVISAVWDPWEKFPNHLDELQKTDIYTLRRIVPKDRGQLWGDKK